MPRSLLKAIRRRGINPETFILEAIAEKLSRDTPGRTLRLAVKRPCIELGWNQL